MAAQKPTVGYLPAIDEEARAAQLAYEEAERKLLEALDARKNRWFDPKLLAMAQGFAAPTKTGHFIESLGAAMKGFQGAEEAQLKEEQDLAKMRLELAGMGVQRQRQKMLDQPYMEMMDGPKPQPPEASKEPVGALPSPVAQAPSQAQAKPSESTPELQAAGAIGGGRRVAPPTPLPDKAQWFAAKRAAGVPFPDAQAEWQKILKEDIEFREGKIFQRSTGMVFDSSTDVDVKPVTLRTVPGVDEPINVPGELAKRHVRLLDEAMRTGDYTALREFEKRLISRDFGAPAAKDEDRNVAAAVAEFSGVGAGEGRIRTPSEVAAAGKAKETSAVKRAEDRAARTSTAMTNAEKAMVATPVYEQLNELSRKPTFNKIAGAFTNKNVMSQIIRLAESGIGMSGFSVGIPGIRDVATNMKFNNQEMADYQQLGQLLVKMQLDASVAQKGAVSDYERGLLAKAALTLDDTPQTLIRKINAARRTNEFYAQMGDMLERTGMDYDAFVRTPEGRDMYRSFIKDMGSLVGDLPAGRAASSAPEKPSLATSLEEEIRRRGR